MAYYISLFSPSTHDAFTRSGRDISGFRMSQRRAAERIRPGDKLICYLTKLSRWVGVFEVTSPCFVDATPLFQSSDDPYCVRFQVNAAVWLPLEQTIPVQSAISWEHLSFTKNLPRNSRIWTGIIRNSLNRLTDADGHYLEALLRRQAEAPIPCPLSERDERYLHPPVVDGGSGPIAVTVPDDECSEQEAPVMTEPAVSEHTRIQACLAQIGETLRMQIWLPRNDRHRVAELWQPAEERTLLDRLSFNFNDAVLRTIENIDVLWVRRNSIVHAFEIEHTTSIYSGLLRMADLMAMMPNLRINAHIVAAAERRSQVMQEITRPVFSLLEGGPMSDSCSYLSYDSVYALGSEPHLNRMNDSILNDYIEFAPDADL